MKSPISLCIIVKNEPFLEQCLLSIKDYVSEIVIVDTGSTDGTSLVAAKYADIFEVYTDCNNPETGLIEDFSMARQRSFDLATQPWVMWCDADDLIEGGEYLINYIEEYNFNKSLSDNNKHDIKNINTVMYLFPYEYAYDETGKCILQHYRERLFLNKNYYKWVNPVHEVIIPINDPFIPQIPKDKTVFKHKRQFTNKISEPGRNLRILQKYYEKVGDTDARQLYYLGLEYSNVGDNVNAINYLVKYINLSGWEDEKVMACMKLIEIYCKQAQYQEGLIWAFKAIEIKEDWSEGYLALSKLFYFMAMDGGANEFRYWQKCVFFGRKGLELPPTKTLLFVNPADREFHSHIYLNYALSKLGDTRGALESANQGLQYKNDPMLETNKKMYENFLARDQIIQNINTLKINQEISQNSVEIITKLINTKMSQERNINDFIMMRQLVSNKDSKQINKTILDIVFFIGDGVEIWTPNTVKNTGIGGSELMAIEMSKRLASLGHKVRIYSGCGQFGEGIYDGVEYHTTDKYQNLGCDILVVSRRADMLADQYNITAKLKLLWLHDVCAINATNELLLKADKILCLSAWHKQNVVGVHNLHSEHVLLTRNGVDISRFNKNIKRDKFKCINSSSPDRSWPVLLQLWPKIKEQVPEATLTLAYGFKNWEFGAQKDPLQMNLINRLKSQIKSLESLGVRYIDRVSQEELSKEICSSGVWVHPTWFTETSCISAMEMQAAGLRMVSSNIGALQTTVANRGILLDYEWTSPDYHANFIAHTVNALTKEDDSDRLSLQEYAKNNFSLDELADDWEKMFNKLLVDKKVNPLNPYQPTKKYNEK